MHMFHNAHAELAVRMHMHFGHRILHFGPIFSYTIPGTKSTNAYAFLWTSSEASEDSFSARARVYYYNESRIDRTYSDFVNGFPLV